MADAVTFRAALERCGIAQGQARDSIVDQGYSNMQEFSALSEDDITYFVKAVNKLPAPAGGERPSIPFASIKKLKAMRKWTIECRWLGIPVQHPDFTVPELNRMITRMDFEDQLAVNQPEAPKLPDKFTSFGTKWRAFSEGFKGHCAVVRGCMNIPLSYVYRDHVVPTQEMVDAEYATSDERLMALVRLTGNTYREDNHRVWDILRPLVYGTAAWDYVKTYDTTKNGRTAFRVLEARGEGDAAVDARRTKAEEIIRKSQYTGKSRRFTLQSYINLLQGAFTDMEECGEAYSERKKVDTLVKGLIPERLATARTTIIANAAYRNDFQAAYSFLETMEQFQPTINSGRDGFDRNISQVGQGNGNDTVDTSFRSKEQWLELSKEERAKIQSARDKKKTKTGKRKQGGRGGNGGDGRKSDNEKYRRKLAELATEVIMSTATGGTEGKGSGGSQERGSEEQGQKQGSKNPADQFGRQAHAVAKVLEAVMKESATQGKKDDKST